MSDNAEEGIFRAQAAAAKAEGTQGDALRKHHSRGIGYMDERILTSLLGIATLGLIVVWATATSPLVLYGSFAGVIFLTLLFGYTRIKRIERTKLEREQEASSWQSDQSD
jgi:hypothetical protein